MSEPLRPQFFVLRQNGSIVPLIAMDEIPHNIRVEGVPRTMTIKDTIGMINMGEYPTRHKLHQVIDTNKSSETYKYKFPRSNMIQDARFDEESVTPIVRLPVEVFTGPNKAFGIVEQPPSRNESEITPTIATPSTQVIDTFGTFDTLPPWKDVTDLGPRQLVPGKKVYCTHWMSTGECDYAQQGCLYKHEMPTKLEVLNLLGYQDIPKWYREKYGIGRLIATPGSGAAIAGPNLRSAAMAVQSWRALAGDLTVNTRSSQKTTNGSPKPNNKSFRGRGQIPNLQHHHHTSPSLIDIDRQERLARPRPTRTITVAPDTQNQLYASRFAPSKPQPAKATTVQLPEHLRIMPAKPSNKFTPQTSQSNSQSASQSQSPALDATTRSRTSSLFSDVETDFIRENDLRRATEEANYALDVKKAADAKKEAEDKETDE